MKKTIPYILFYFIFSAPAFSEESFVVWLNSIKKEAITQGISKNTVDKYLHSGLTLNEDIIKRDRNQPEFALSFWDYIDKALSEKRISKGKQLLKKHQKDFARIEKKYGISPHYLAAFWGMETFYGEYMGQYDPIEALVTLSYDLRRRDFFKKHLFILLELLDKNKIESKDLKSSWAGAMGNFQFMPLTLKDYGTDADNNGKINIWNSLTDSFESAGNYLSLIGWSKGELWGREVILPLKFNYASFVGKKEKKSLKDWSKIGIKQSSGEKLPNLDILASLILPAGHKGPAFLVYNNFDVIMKWNKSEFYALAIGLVADRLVDRPVLKRKYDKNNKITTEQIKNVQQKLTDLGLYNSDIDGIIGSSTKNAVIKYQNIHNLIADGFLDKELLKLLFKK